MADILTSEQRSRNMAAIHSKDTKPEIYIRKKLFSLGYRYRKNYSHISGHPDIYLAKYRSAIFIHGCYWHRHENCRYAYMPKSRVDFWVKKFNDNVRRDNEVRHALEECGIRCLVVWECSIRRMQKSMDEEQTVLKRICAFLSSNSQYMEI